MNGRLTGALGLAVGLAVSCAPPRVDFREVQRSYQPGDYAKVLKRWSREQGLHKGVYSIVHLGATFKSWDFRQAYVALYAERYALAPAERRTLLQQQRTQDRDALEFFVSLAPSSPRWADLDKERSIWHLALLNDQGIEVHPLTVERQQRADLEVRMFFPYHTPFAEAFLVRFPRRSAKGKPLVTPRTRRLILRLAGAPGHVELKWLAGEPGAAPATAR